MATGTELAVLEPAPGDDEAAAPAATCPAGTELAVLEPAPGDDEAAAAAATWPAALPSFQVGDRVKVIRSRHNAFQPAESYKVGEAGVVVFAPEHSSVVHVQLEGEYEVIDRSVHPPMRRKVQGRRVAASVLHLADDRPPEPEIVDEAPDKNTAARVQASLLDVERSWLTAIFKHSDARSLGRVNKEELTQSITSSKDIAGFFGLTGQEEPEVHEALFREIAGRDGSITWHEFCIFYLRRLERVAAEAGAEGEEDKIVPAEEAKLREIFDQCEADGEGRARVAEILERARRIEGCTPLLYGLRRRLRNDALQDVIRGVVEGIAVRLGGDDGDITLTEVMQFAEGDGTGMTLAEKAWLDDLFKKAYATGVQVGVRPGERTFASKEGEAMTRQQFAGFCKASPEQALMFGLRRRWAAKSLEDATRDAFANVLQGVLKVVRGPDPDDPRVQWDALRSLYMGGMRHVATTPLPFAKTN